ncbi:MAG: tyrosine recombinase XerD [Actinomycetia bacterium]|jgi:integrase/recombinase XerD|nr:tyrosine recombinase XerD [Actinomycetes bacterium]
MNAAAPVSGGSSALDQLLAEHDVWLTVERGLAQNSLAAYRRDLRRYRQFLAARGALDPGAIGEGTVASYVAYLQSLTDDDGATLLAPSSVARALVAVRSFHRFCAAEGLLPADPSEDVGAPRVPQGLPKALDEGEVEALLGAVLGDTPTALRDRAMLELLYATGIRISELVGLDRGDLMLEDAVLRVLGKGNRERIVPVGRSARAALDEYLTTGRPSLRTSAGRGRNVPRRTADGAAVFLNARGGRISRQACWKIVNHTASRVGLADRISPHVLRHSCATHMIDHGADIRVVQELLGHASLSTTQVYTRVSPERLRAVYEAAHPRARRDARRS